MRRAAPRGAGAARSGPATPISQINPHFACPINSFERFSCQICFCSGGNTSNAEPGMQCDNEHRSKLMSKFFARFIKDESGATAIEYGLIASLISIAAIAAFNSVGGKLKSTFNDIANNLSS